MGVWPGQTVAQSICLYWPKRTIIESSTVHCWVLTVTPPALAQADHQLSTCQLSDRLRPDQIVGASYIASDRQLSDSQHPSIFYFILKIIIANVQ